MTIAKYDTSSERMISVSMASLLCGTGGCAGLRWELPHPAAPRGGCGGGCGGCGCGCGRCGGAAAAASGRLPVLKG